jgi:SEC-C motif
MQDPRSDDDLLKQLATEEDQLPRAVVDEIIRRGERLSPALLRIVEDRPAWERPSPACCAPIHATFILAALQAPGIFEPLMRAVRTAFELDEMFVTDHADLLLAACGPGSLDALIAAARNAADPFELRISVNEAIARIGLAHASARNRARDHLLATAQNKKEDPELRNLAAYGFAEFATSKDRDLLRELQKQDLVDSDVVDLASSGRYPPHYGVAIDLLDLYDPEAIEERKKFRDEIDEEPVEPELPDDPSLQALSHLDEPAAAPAPLVNAAPKIGRNDPCPCGSGRKYKKCCGG